VVLVRCPGIACSARRKSLGNMRSAEVALRQHSIMDGAEQSQILRHRGSATRPRLLVVDLKKRARRAATATAWGAVYTFRRRSFIWEDYRAIQKKKQEAQIARRRWLA
jgi:hypothetical protein